MGLEGSGIAASGGGGSAVSTTGAVQDSAARLSVVATLSGPASAGPSTSAGQTLRERLKAHRLRRAMAQARE
jgi:hypothetical protein